MPNLRCQGCDKEIVLANPNVASGNLQALMKETGCEVIIHLDTSVGWWCPACTARAAPHIEALLGLLGDENGRPRAQHAYWNGLVHIVQRKRSALPKQPMDGATFEAENRAAVEAERSRLFRCIWEHDLSKLPVSVLSKIVKIIEQDIWSAELSEKASLRR